MFVAGLYKNLTCPDRAIATTRRAGCTLSDLSACVALECDKMVAMSLTFFGFTLGPIFAGGAQTRPAKGAESSVIFGGVKA